MKHLPKHKTIIQLSLGDMQQAMEFWLNSVFLKEPCTVTAVKELSALDGGTFEIEFGRQIYDEPEAVE